MNERSIPSTDLTGTLKAQLEQEREDEIVRRRDELATVYRAEQQAKETEVVDVTANAPTILDEVEVITDENDDTVVVRVREDVEQATIGRKIYSFEAGRKYRVPANVRDVLQRSNKLY